MVKEEEEEEEEDEEEDEEEEEEIVVVEIVVAEDDAKRNVFHRTMVRFFAALRGTHFLSTSRILCSSSAPG